MKFSERAAMNTRALIAHVGIELPPRGKHFDCPVCDGKDKARVSFETRIEGGAWVCPCCTGNRYKPILDMCYRASGKDFAVFAKDAEDAGVVAESDSLPPTRRERRAFTYRKSDVQESRYLSNRGLHVPPGLSFGFHGTSPVMVGDVVDSRGEVIGRHFTYLENGRKRAENPRKYQKRFDDSHTVGRIELMPHDGTLGVAEGIETALAAHTIFGIPCWSCMDARQLSLFEAPNDVTELRIFGDYDLSGTGQASAWELYRRTMATKRARSGELTVHVPEFPDRFDTDWNDVLLQKRAV